MTLPAHDYFDHPVFHPATRLHLQTPMQKTLADTLLRWLWTGASGGVIMGRSRVGKTHAIQQLAPQLKNRAGQVVPALYFAIPMRDRRTVASIFRHLCWSVDLPVRPQDTADLLAERFVHFMADRAAAAHSDQAFLFVDEMQRLSLDQFNAFAEIHDALLQVDVTSTVVFIGNEQECQSAIEHVQDDRYAHIRGRFFTHGLTMFGLQSMEDVRACLTQYDQLHFPEHGPSYTAYFLPDLWRKGWRARSLDRPLWMGFSDYQRKFGIPSWPMRYFVDAVNLLLTDFLPHLGAQEIDDDLINECIGLTGLVPSLVVPTR